MKQLPATVEDERFGSAMLLVEWTEDGRPSEHYEPRLHPVGLYKASTRLHGRQFFVASDPEVGKSWLLDEQAERLLSGMGEPRVRQH